MRLIAAAAIGRFHLHLDGGWAHDRVNGAYHPWRASVEMALPFGALSIARESTIFYRASTIRLTIVRRVERR